MQAVTEAPQAAALDLHEGISTPRSRTGCERWPARFYLRSSLGEMVPGRCRATNLCKYCARLAAVENSEVLALDAMYGPAPTIWAVLTTADAEPDPSAFYRSREKVQRALRRRWPDVEYAALVEFTTGYGPKSGGARRPHWNLMLKGIPVQDLDAARDVIVGVWCSRENAVPEAQSVKEIDNAGGLMRYISLHFQKEQQSPPSGWRGHRFVKSRGYLWTDTPAAREEARRGLRLKREIWRATERGLDPHDAELVAREAIELAESTTWTFHELRSQAIPAAPGERDAVRARSEGATLERIAEDEAWAYADDRAWTEERMVEELRVQWTSDRHVLGVEGCLCFPLERLDRESEIWNLTSAPGSAILC